MLPAYPGDLDPASRSKPGSDWSRQPIDRDAASKAGCRPARPTYCDAAETLPEIPRLKKETNMRKIAILMGVVMILTACNTVRGIGRDVESVGRTVSDVAD